MERKLKSKKGRRRFDERNMERLGIYQAHIERWCVMEEATLYFDGGIRRGVCAYGWLLVNEYSVTTDDGIFASGHRTCGKGTSNIAEYRALIAGLQGSIEAGVDIVHIIGDSQLIIKQVLKTFKTNKPELRRHRDRVLELLEQFEDYTIKWIPRHENKRADALVNQVFERRNKKCIKRKDQRRRS